MNGTTGRPAVAVLLAAVMVVAAGCVSGDTGSRPSASAPATTTTSVTTTSAAPQPVTLAEMAEHPCRAINDDQMFTLLVIPGKSQEGGEQESGFRQCQWMAVQGALLFGPHPAIDMTVDPRVAQLEPGELDGHRTMLGVDTARDRCILYVAVAEGQSFQVAIHPEAGQNLGMRGCDLIKELASYVLANLS